MSRELVVLVKSEEMTVRKKRYNPFYGHYCTAREIEQRTRGLSPDEAKTIARVQEFTKHEKMVFRILGISDLRVRLRYRLARDERTPIVICGRRMFRGVPTMSDLSKLVG